ncbi:MAG: hypothetical protein PVJ92_01740, partial [Candidatus Dependentiae bacterium]
MSTTYHLYNTRIAICDDAPTSWQQKIGYDLARYLGGMERFSPQQVTHQLRIAPYSQRPKTTALDTIPGYASYGSVTDFPGMELCLAWQRHSLESPVDAQEHDILYVWHSGAREFPLPFLLQQLLVKQEATFVHAAGIAVDGRAILVPAFGSIGKTAFCAQVAHHDNVTLLGDDLLIARSDGLLAPYPRPFCLYDYHAPLFKGYFATHYLPWHTNWKLTHKVIRFIARQLNLHQKLDGYVTSTHRNVAPAQLFGADHIEQEVVPLSTVVIATRRHDIKQPVITPASEQKV